LACTLASLCLGYEPKARVAIDTRFNMAGFVNPQMVVALPSLPNEKIKMNWMVGKKVEGLHQTLTHE
jgi:hypothetical protein